MSSSLFGIYPPCFHISTVFASLKGNSTLGAGVGVEAIVGTSVGAAVGVGTLVGVGSCVGVAIIVGEGFTNSVGVGSPPEPSSEPGSESVFFR